MYIFSIPISLYFANKTSLYVAINLSIFRV